MAAVAFKDNWYDSTIKFLRASKQLYENTKHIETYNNQFVESLHKMSSQIHKLHNAFLTQRRDRVGSGIGRTFVNIKILQNSLSK
jgi:hypothetical protein